VGSTHRTAGEASRACCLTECAPQGGRELAEAVGPAGDEGEGPGADAEAAGREEGPPPAVRQRSSG